MTNDNTAELAFKAASGNRYAFNLLVEEVYHDIYRLCYRYCGVREDAEDVTQEVFIKLGKGIGSFKGDSAFRTWLYRLAVNVIQDHFRKVKKTRKNIAFDESLELESGDESSEEVIYKKQVVKAVDALPPKLKQVVVLVYAEDMSHSEVAKILGCSEGTVSWRIHEAKKKLSGVKEKIRFVIFWIF
jgi:RNA polymerase sigma-70 factor (ECF subfamily)